MPDQGEIVLIPVPFTDLASQKRRPVIVISSTIYNNSSADMVVVARTSSPAASPYCFTLTSADLVNGALNRPGTVRVDKVYTLAQSIVVKRFGQVGRPIIERIRQMFDKLTTP